MTTGEAASTIARLAGKTAIVIGAGQNPGEGLGNGHATVMRFAQEGAPVMAVDRDLASAAETVAMAGGECLAFEADVTREASLAAAVAEAARRWGRIDIYCESQSRSPWSRFVKP